MTESVTVTVAQGALRGREGTSKCQKVYYSFQGIPYAKPPVGFLRFKAPQPPEAWEGIRDASEEGAVSPHVQTLLNEGYKGDEDCLFLNVYTPQLPSGDDGPLKAVMVYIHGGGFISGSGTAEFYGPDYFLSEDVVVVTLNYRLGALGFLSTGDSVVPGNNGLKDQVMALRWVQQNIAQFGGDPGNVTIFGESAGAACVHYHMLSPMSEGLFSRAIAQSGCALNPWAFNTRSEARRKAFRFGETLGCKTNDSKELAQFLNAVPAQQLVEGVSEAMTEVERDLGTVFFKPTAEVENQDVFLPAEPADLITLGKFHEVPFLTGVNSSEGLLCLREVMAKPAVLKKYDNDFEILLPSNLNLERNTPKSKEAAQKIKSFYFGDQPVSQETLSQYVDLSSDAWFVTGVHTTAKLHAARSGAPVYLYQFSFDGELGFMKRILGACRFPGVCHADELGYLFFSPHLDVELEGTPEEKMRSLLVKMWTNFAKTGNPSLPDVKWESVTESNPCYLNIGTELTMQPHLMKDRMTFWDELKQTLSN
ncbi:Esterase FE4 [Cryptotermes secundus]|uniref:Carboxylic ester hydrolase n=1 Tax=Cryptotermes secundus TaxID=105785 RepID=A0A2J7RMN7_9NEOP|nr:Esterase FE4 [Cryptotermes secundus]